MKRPLTEIRIQVLNEHTDARGELVFRQACAMGLEGIVADPGAGADDAWARAAYGVGQCRPPAAFAAPWRARPSPLPPRAASP
jgi:hypothetical protein